MPPITCESTGSNHREDTSKYFCVNKRLTGPTDAIDQYEKLGIQVILCFYYPIYFNHKPLALFKS